MSKSATREKKRGDTKDIHAKASDYRVQIDTLLNTRDAHVQEIDLRIDALKQRALADIKAVQDECPHKEVVQSAWDHGRESDIRFRACTACGLVEREFSHQPAPPIVFTKLSWQKPVRDEVKAEEVIGMNLLSGFYGEIRTPDR